MCDCSISKKDEKKEISLYTRYFSWYGEIYASLSFIYNKTSFFWETGLTLSEYSSIYFIMEGGSTDSKDRESVFAKRMTRYEVDTILGTMSFSMFFFQLSVGPIIFWTWHMSDPLIVIIRYLFILILVLFNFLKVFLVIYKCYLYLWHRKWEETYKDILSAGKAAPNIETIEFPKI